MEILTMVTRTHDYAARREEVSTQVLRNLLQNKAGRAGFGRGFDKFLWDRKTIFNL